jgi:hypothetical protein
LCFILAAVIIIAVKIAFYADIPIITIGPSRGTSSTDAAAAIAQASQMNQIAQWSITTVLTLGAALIGLNIYSSRMTREEERERFRILDQESNKRLTELREEITADLALQKQWAESAQASLLRLGRMQYDLHRITPRSASSTRIHEHLIGLLSFLNVAVTCSTVESASYQMISTINGLLEAYEPWIISKTPIEVSASLKGASYEILQHAQRLEAELAERWIDFHHVLEEERILAEVGEIEDV